MDYSSASLFYFRNSFTLFFSLPFNALINPFWFACNDNFQFPEWLATAVTARQWTRRLRCSSASSYWWLLEMINPLGFACNANFLFTYATTPACRCLAMSAKAIFSFCDSFNNLLPCGIVSETWFLHLHGEASFILYRRWSQDNVMVAIFTFSSFQFLPTGWEVSFTTYQ
jgi:hypothetical protein